MRFHGLVSLAAAAGLTLSLSACDVSTPSQVYTGKLRVKEQIITETLDATAPDPARVKALARDILQNGRGPVTITAPYPAGVRVREGIAAAQGAAYKSALEKEGVPHVSVVTVPVADARHADKIVLDYAAVAAVPSRDCDRIPGYIGAENVQTIDRYRFGCDMQSSISRMVADPTDLLGKGGAQDNDSRRSGTIIEPYKSGTPNEPMGGMQASQIGNGG